MPMSTSTNPPAIEFIADLSDMYHRVAEVFASRIEEMFSSEESLKAAHNKHFPALPFDRTERWHLTLHKELQAVWRQHGPAVTISMTAADCGHVLRRLATLLDYNLFTQVLLNLQDWHLLRYRVTDAESIMSKLEGKWAGRKPSPFDPKAKMFKAAGNENLSIELNEFNQDLSRIKAMQIIAKLGPGRSFRVSPRGSTPSLVDSENLSMLGVGGDPFLIVPPGMAAFYLTWETAPEVVTVEEDGKFHSPLIPYPFTSRSGGETLNSVLAARLLTSALYAFLPPEANSVMLPRMTSLMLLTDADRSLVEEFVSLASKGWFTDEVPWPMSLCIGARGQG